MIFDLHANKLFLFHSPATILSNDKSLMNTFDLNEYDSYFDHVECQESRKNSDLF